MKFPTKLFLLSILCAGLCAGTLSACGEQLDSGGEKGEDGHTHTYVETEIPATCDQEGKKSFACSVCGEKKADEIIPALGHSFEVLSHKDPTCTEGGITEKKCSRCGKTETETLPANGHSWGEVQVLEEPTCEKDGLRSAVCSVCGAHEENQVIKSSGHDFKEISHQDPTCTEDGYSELKCTVCKEKKTEKLTATGHVEGERKMISDATCSQEGSVEVYCSVCKTLIKTETIPKKEHSFGEWTVVKSATCTAEGEEKRTCSVCKFEEKKTVQPLAHNFDDKFTFDKYPTSSEEGEKSRHCLNKGCDARTDVTKVGKVKDHTDYKITLKNSLGEELPADCVPTIEYYDGDELKSTQQGSGKSVTLPTKNYKIKVSGLPLGYQPKEEYEVTFYEPECEIRIPASVIEEEKMGQTYVIGSILYDKEITILGFTEQEDETTTFKEILTNYKAILLNLYFTTCPACVYEMPHFVEAYNKTSSTGKKYGEEVACLMLDNGTEKEERIRNFKKNTKTYYSGYTAAYNLPMMMFHDRWLSSSFSRKLAKGYPTSILIDCEGRIVESYTKCLGVSEFSGMMQRGIDRYDQIHAWRVREGLESTENTLFVRYDLLPADRKRLGT